MSNYFQIENKVLFLINRILPRPTSLALIKKSYKCISFNTGLIPSPCKTTCSNSSYLGQQKFQLNFSQLDPNRNNKHNLLQQSTFSLDLLKTFTVAKKDPNRKKKRVPKLILLQNPFRWLMTKIDFSVLRSVWDPSFTEKEFKFGTKQVCVSCVPSVYFLVFTALP